MLAGDGQVDGCFQGTKRSSPWRDSQAELFRVRPSFHVIVTDWTEHVGSDSDDTDSQLFLCVYELPSYSLVAINQVQEHSALFSCL